MKAILCKLLRGYQILLSPLLHFVGGPGCGCRFAPSCSQYGIEAISHYGCKKGLWMTLTRLCKCHPWGGQGYDPPVKPSSPEQSPSPEKKTALS